MTSSRTDGPERWALIVVDVQLGFVTHETEELVPGILGHLRDERSRYGSVIATRFVNRAGSLYATERDWDAMRSGRDIELVPGVAEQADHILAKHGLAPDAAELLPILRRHGVERVELCGFDTDQCVLATALLLWDAGIPPRILVPLCASSGGREMHLAGLAISRRAIGDRNVVDLEGRPV